MKLFLTEQVVETAFPKDTIREAFARGLLENDPLWLRTIELRNLSNHTYNESLAEDIYRELDKPLKLFQKLAKRLSSL